MGRFSHVCAVAITMAAFAGSAPQAQAQGPYKLVKTVKVGGPGRFDTAFADVGARRLYIPRSGDGARITVFDLDTLAPAGEIPSGNANGVIVDPKSGHGFATSKPVLMFGREDSHADQRRSKWPERRTPSCSMRLINMSTFSATWRRTPR